MLGTNSGLFGRLRLVASVTRRVFLRGTLVFLAGIGLSAFAGCSEATTDVIEGSDPTAGTNVPSTNTGNTTTGSNGAIEIPMAPSLRLVGGSQIVDDPQVLRTLRTDNGNRHGNEPILLVRVGPDQIAANTVLCTHKGCPVHYDAAQGNLVCPCHEARFGLDGRVLAKPAKRPLLHFKATIVGESVLLERA